MRNSIQPVRHADSPRGGGGGGGAPTPRRDASGGDGGEPLSLISQGGDDGRGVGRGSQGDVAPLAVDASVGWDKVGGLQHHVEALKEMVVMPLLYPEVFASLGVTPPRGVLFHGPPGTGKTLVARAVANTCSVGGRRVTFFMRKGADVLSKVGPNPQ